jgi:hypothetical protein
VDINADSWVAHLVDPIDHSRPDDAPVDLARAADEFAALQIPGPGWTPILDELHRQLVLLDPGYRLLQVKEKLGHLRVYAGFERSVADECQRLVREAEARAARTCERCGQPGQLRQDRRWRLTLCDDCHAREPEGRPNPTDW